MYMYIYVWATCTCTYRLHLHVHMLYIQVMCKCTYRLCVHVHTYRLYVHVHIGYMYISVFDKLIGPKSFLFGTVQFSLWASGTVNYATNSIKTLLIGSRCIPNGAHTNHC